jgi:hypothetical protein
VKESKRNYGEAIPHPTVEGTICQNKMDTHADTCCAGANWKLLDSTNEVCKVTPFLDSYEPVKEVMVTRCGTVWTSPDTGHEYLLVGDQMLWFGSQMDHALINPNQIREYGLPVYDDPFSKQQFGIDGNEAFFPFNTTGTIVYFETRVPTDWKTCNLPIIMLTGEEWDPVNVGLGTGQSREQAEMRTIRSLESGVPKWKMAAFKQCELDSRMEQWGQVESELGKLSETLNKKTFCKRLIGSVNVATAYRNDVDEVIKKRKESGVLTMDRHSKVGPEELSRKWNIGLQMAKDTLDVTTQHGVRMAVHPMTRRLRVDHLHLHRPRLKGMWFLDTMIAKVKSLLGNKCANVFTNGKFTKVVPMTSRKEAAELLIDFTDDVGIPEMLMMDGVTEFTGRHTDFIKQAQQMHIKLHMAEQGRKNQNHAAE